MGNTYLIMSKNDHDVCGWKEVYRGESLIIALLKMMFCRDKIIDFQTRRL